MVDLCSRFRLNRIKTYVNCVHVQSFYKLRVEYYPVTLTNCAHTFLYIGYTENKFEDASAINFLQSKDTGII